MKNAIRNDVLRSAKNPIGVIGLFLVLVEAIAAFVIVQSSLPEKLNSILVLFIVFFPCIVLFVFYLLVTKHHEKLYSPSDYKDEKNFVNTYNSSTQMQEIVEAEKQQETIQAKEGMTSDDIKIIKETLNSVLAIQKEMIIKGESLSSTTMIEDIEADINQRLDEYDTEKRYKIHVSYMNKSTTFIERLSSLGYSSEIYLGPFGNDKEKKKYFEHESIWLGRKVPIDMAVEVIKTAKNIFPHLKYIDLSDGDAPEYTGYQIYIGGASSTAVERGLKKLSISDFEKLYTIQSSEELHNFILDANS